MVTTWHLQPEQRRVLLTAVSIAVELGAAALRAREANLDRERCVHQAGFWAVAAKPDLRRAGADCRLELRLGSRAAGKWAQDRQVDAGLPVRFDPLAAMLRRSGDAGGIDQCIADCPLGGFPISACPGGGNR